MDNKKAVLVVSFGTTYNDTREKTIDKIEEEIGEAFPDYAIYRAWTSKIIISRLKARQGIVVPTVSEALDQMIRDSIRDIIVQPTHILNGVENDIMKADVMERANEFEMVSFGNPVLTTDDDNREIIRAVIDELGEPGEKEALVLMGHGTTHYVNLIYAALDYTFKDMGYSNVVVGTVEAYPDIENVKKQLRMIEPEKVTIAPFMIVAGDHATNDMAGDDEDSWKSILQAEGYEVKCVMRGLGEYQAVRKIIKDHAKNAVK